MANKEVPPELWPIWRAFLTGFRMGRMKIATEPAIYEMFETWLKDQNHAE